MDDHALLETTSRQPHMYIHGALASRRQLVIQKPHCARRASTVGALA